MDWSILRTIDRDGLNAVLWITGLANLALYLFILARLRRRAPTDGGLTGSVLARQSREPDWQRTERSFGIVDQIQFLFRRQNHWITDAWVHAALWIMRLLFAVWAALTAWLLIAPPAWS